MGWVQAESVDAPWCAALGVLRIRSAHWRYSDNSRSFDQECQAQADAAPDPLVRYVL